MDKYRAYQEKERSDQAYRDFRKFKERIGALIDSIPEIEEPKFTGWFVLLRKNKDHPSGFGFLTIFNPDISDPETEPEWDMCLPIRTPESIPEFMGW